MIKSRDRLVVVTRKTAPEGLVERFNSRDRARFDIEHMGGRFDEYQAAHDAYHAAVEHVREAIPRRVRSQWIDRSFLPTFEFEGGEVVAVLGQDGLLVDAAKHLDDRPVVALNPDPARVDGVLLPFSYVDASSAIERAREPRDRHRFDRDARPLVFHVREPFISKISGAELVRGLIEPDQPLEIVSHMPQNGVILGDGVEEDRLDFNSGAIARIGLADRTPRLVVPEGVEP